MGIILPDKLYIPSINASVPVKITRERRRSLRASVGKSSLLFRMPTALSKDQFDEAWHWFTQWVLQLTEKKPSILNHLMPKIYKNGEFINIRGIIYKIDIQKSSLKTSKAYLGSNQTIELKISQSANPVDSAKIAGDLILRFMSKLNLSEIQHRVYELNNIHFKAKIKDIKLSNTNSRWGSCSKSGVIRLASRLMLAPNEVMDYVIIHELAHLIEFNHSTNFWKLVAEAMPDYKEKEKWLKINNYQCNF
ncbi:MAG: M48 family peptidase [Bacteroidetes bacterium]|nr:M48 family peptidase [Bacteroidota bacterium]